MKGRHVLFLHSELSLSSATERLFRTALYLIERGALVTVLTDSGSRADAFSDAGIALEPGELTERPLAQPFVTLRTRRRVASLAPDLVHVTSERLAALAALLGRPYVLEVQHELDERLSYHDGHLRAVVLPGPTLEEGAVNKAGLPRDRMRVIEHGPAPPDGLHGARFTAGEPIRVGCAGLLDSDHGTEVFVEAARRLALSETPYLFFVFGEGPEEERLRRRVRELAITDCTTITAPAAPDSAQLLSRLDVYVSCLRDGTPGWLAHEALALGLPSIFSSASGSFSLIEDGESGVIVERGDPDKLAAAIAGLAANPLGARQMGDRARRQRIAERRVDRFEEALEALYSEALDGAPVAAG